MIRNIYRAVACFILIGSLCTACDTGDSNGGSKPKVTKYAITMGGPFVDGTVSVKDNLISAEAGAVITLITTPIQGWRLAALTVRRDGVSGAAGNVPVTLNGNEGTFTMPEGAVLVQQAAFVSIVPRYLITITGQYLEGNVRVKDQFQREKGVPEGEKVILSIEPSPGYQLTHLFGKHHDGTDEPLADLQESDVANEWWFTMPGVDVLFPADREGAIFEPIE